MSTVVDRFLRYVTVDTQADDTNASQVPSTPGQHDLAKILGEELQELGLADVIVDEHAYVTATLPSNVDHPVPAIGFCAHIDTALEVSGKDVKPRLVENYDGGDVILNTEENVVLSPSVFPDLKQFTGDTLIVTDGTTLLGADDKAGIAEIIAALEYMVQHPEFKHGDVKVCFCPDEEIGHGARLLDLEKFGADFCYTIDGGTTGEFAYETFNAAKAVFTVRGRSVHPGSSKNKMVNALLIASELIQSFPPAETPAHTEKYEGFYHLCSLNGGVENAVMEYIVRDHDRQRFEARKEMIRTLARQMNERYGEGTVSVELNDQYYNMADLIRQEMHIVHTALKAMEDAGVTPRVIPVRGGTDGSQLSYRGMLTPNIFTGGLNAHGKYECVPVSAMEKAVQVILNILHRYATGQEVR